MSSIFLSYARVNRASAERLATILESAGYDVWWDRRIDGGQDFSAQIEAALNQAAVVLVIWSKEAVTSRWVRDEAAVGGDTGRLIPVSIDGSRPPMGFRQYHTIDLNGWRGAKGDRRTATLLHSVERLLNDGETHAQPLSVRRNRWLRWPIFTPRRAVAALALSLIAGAALFLLFRPSSQTGPLPKPTIGLVPFTTASNDAELRDIAAQAGEAVSHALSQTGMPVRQLTALPKDPHSAGDFILSAVLSKNAGKVVAVMRLDETDHGVTILSRRIESDIGEIHDLPERIGAQTASFFVGPNLMVLDRRHPMDPALMAELLVDTGDQLQSYQIFKRVAAKAPNVPAAQIGVAFSTGFVLGELPRPDRAEAVAGARRAYDRAIRLAPEFGDTHASWCMLHSETRLAECEDRLRDGSRIDPDAPYLNTFLSPLLLNVGRFGEAVETTRLSFTHDPYDDYKIGAMLRMLEFAGDTDGTRKLYRDAIRWWPDQKVSFFANRLMGLIYRADFDAMTRLETEVGATALPPNFVGSRAIGAAVKSKSQAALRGVCARGKDILIDTRCMVAFATLNDQDDAYEIAARLYPKRIGRTPAETERIWLDDPDGGGRTALITSPAAASMRRDPRFLPLAQSTGLLGYWRSGRAPDFCRVREPVCAQLHR